MEAAVDVADTTGATLAAAPRVAAPYTTAAFTHDAEEADALVRRTIAANLGLGADGGRREPHAARADAPRVAATRRRTWRHRSVRAKAPVAAPL